MRSIGFFVLLLGIHLLSAQCPALIAKAEEDIQVRRYQDAINKLLLLQEECPDQGKQIGNLIQKTFDLIRGERDKATAARQRADSLLKTSQRTNQIMEAMLQRNHREELLDIQAGKLPDLYVISIGIGDYQGNIIDLKGPVNDAKLVIQTWGAENPLFAHTYNYLLVNEEATKDNILLLLQEIVDRSRPKDLVYIHISGQGFPNEGPYQGSFLAHDFTTSPFAPSKEGLIKEEFYSLLKKEDAFVILFLDYAESYQALIPFRQAAQSQNPEDFLHRVFGFGVEGTAYEAKVDDLSHGKLSYASCYVISDQRLDTDQNGVLYLDEFYFGILALLGWSSLSQDTLSPPPSSQPAWEPPSQDLKKPLSASIPATIFNLPVHQYHRTFALPIQERPLNPEHPSTTNHTNHPEKPDE